MRPYRNRCFACQLSSCRAASSRIRSAAASASSSKNQSNHRPRSSSRMARWSSAPSSSAVACSSSPRSFCGHDHVSLIEDRLDRHVEPGRAIRLHEGRQPFERRRTWIKYQATWHDVRDAGAPGGGLVPLDLGLALRLALPAAGHRHTDDRRGGKHRVRGRICRAPLEKCKEIAGLASRLLPSPVDEAGGPARGVTCLARGQHSQDRAIQRWGHGPGRVSQVHDPKVSEAI